MIKTQPGIRKLIKPSRGVIYDLTNPIVKLMSGSWTFDEGVGPNVPCEISKGFYDINLPSSGGILTNNYSWQLGPRGNVLDRGVTADATTNGPTNAFNPSGPIVWFAFRIYPRQVASDTYGQLFTNISSGNGIYLRNTGAIDFYISGDHLSSLLLNFNAWNEVVIWWSDKVYFVINGILDTTSYTLGSLAVLNKFLPGTEPLSCQIDYFHFGNINASTASGSGGAVAIAQSLIDDPWQVFQVPNYRKWTTFSGGANIINKSIVDNLTLTESLLLNTILLRTLTDTISVSETIGRLVIFSRSVTDSLTVTDLLTRIAIYNRSLVDSLTPSESVSKVFIPSRTLTDTMSLNDLNTVQKIITKAITDTLTPAEAITLQKIYSRLGIDNLTVTELIGLKTVLNRTITDTINIVETVLAVKPGVTGSIFTVPNENNIISALIKTVSGNVWPATIKVLH